MYTGGPLTQKKGKLENRRLSCQSFSEILRISENVWYETHQYLNWLSKFEGVFLKLKTRSSSYSGLDKSIQKKTLKSHATVSLNKTSLSAAKCY
jgi:hypothetical protein